MPEWARDQRIQKATGRIMKFRSASSKGDKTRRSSVAECLLVLSILMAACEDPESRQQLKILHQLAGDIPLYPGFEQLRSSDYPNVGHATVIRCYSARANSDDVKQFYSQVLESKGWTRAEEQRLGGFHAEGSYRLHFKKGKYAVVLQHDNLDDPSGKCNYSLEYYWNPP